MKKSELFMCKM